MSKTVSGAEALGAAAAPMYDPLLPPWDRPVDLRPTSVNGRSPAGERLDQKVLFRQVAQHSAANLHHPLIKHGLPFVAKLPIDDSY